MLIRGGGGGGGGGEDTNPISDSWVATSTAKCTFGRDNLAAIWTGSDIISGAGEDDHNTMLGTGARYNPSFDVWAPISSTTHLRLAGFRGCLDRQ